MIIYGMTPGGVPRVIIRGGGFVWPIVQRAEILSLKVVPIEVLTPAAPTKDGASVAVDAVAQVKVHATPESVRAAAGKFHDVGRDMVIEIVRGLLQNQVRKAVAGLNSAELGPEHTQLAGLIMTSAGSDLAPMGLELVTVNVRNAQGIRK